MFFFSHFMVSLLLVEPACTLLLYNPGRGEGTPRKGGWGCAARFPKVLPFFMTKICDIPYPIYYLTLTSKSCFKHALKHVKLS